MANEHLKSSYQRSLWLFALANLAFFWSVVVIGNFSNISNIFEQISAKDAAFAVLSPIVMLVLSGLVSAINKARIVYWRFLFPLPGSFAFTHFLKREQRADRLALEQDWGKLPTGHGEQNQLWYRMYKDVEDDVRIHEAHRASLFSRDLTAIAVIFLVVFGISAIASNSSLKSSLTYVGFLASQYLLLMIAARTYGSRLVCNVLALQSSKPTSLP